MDKLQLLLKNTKKAKINSLVAGGGDFIGGKDWTKKIRYFDLIIERLKKINKIQKRLK